jgi:ligand-binding SRPBCC domain-containing protein
MRPGTLIDYRIRIHGVPVRWRTEITAWQPPYQFVDEQLRGPYRLWHHTHIFEERDGGTLCTDRVRYAPIGGALLNWLFVRRDVAKIFEYRRQALEKLFC